MSEQETPTKLMKPKMDLVFKKLFSQKELLMPLLNTTLELPEGEKITDITFVDRALSGEFPQDKNIVLDLCVYDQAKNTYHVEIQCRNHPGFPRRVLYYWSRLYLEQIKSGNPYKKLNNVVSIIITDFTMFDHQDYHSTFQFADLQKKLVLTRVGKIHILELTKLPEEAVLCVKPKEQWLYFLKRGHVMERETINRWNTPEIKKAYKELERLSINPKFRMEYEFRLKFLNDRIWELSESHDKGREEGLEEGLTKGLEEGRTKGLEEGMNLGKELARKEEKANLALLLLNDGMDKKRIASLIGISMEELNNILPQDSKDSTHTPSS